MAAPNYEDDAVCHIWNLLVDDDGVLYFIETGRDPDDDGTNTEWSIIRLDQVERQILASMTSPFGYETFTLYQDRLIYVEEIGDSCSIGDVKKDGSDSASIFEAFVDQYGTPYFGHVEFIRDGDNLIMEGSAYIHKTPDLWSEGVARIIIYPDLHTELVWLSGPEEHNYE